MKDRSRRPDSSSSSRTRTAGLLVSVTLACTRPSPEIVLPGSREDMESAVAQLVAQRVEAVRRAPRDATEHGRLGLVYEANGMWEGAQQCYRNAAELDPRDPWWRYRRAIALGVRGDDAAQLAILAVVARELPEHPAPQHRYAVCLLDSGRIDEAQQILRRALRLAPERCEIHTELGNARLRAADYAGAAEHLERAVELDPAYLPARYALGLAYRGLGRLEAAEREMARGVGGRRRFLADPLTEECRRYAVNVSARVMDGTRLLDERRFEQAAAVLEPLLEQEPNSKVILYNLSTAYLGLRQLSRAEERARRAIEADGRYFRAHLNLAMACLGGKRYDEALQHVQRAHTLAPDAARVPFVRGTILSERGDFELAYDELREAARRAPGDVQPLLQLALVCGRMRRVDESIEHCDAALRLEASNVEARLLKVGGLLQKGERVAAREVVLEIEAIDPNERRLAQLWEWVGR